jgi:hypothetical protein
MGLFSSGTQTNTQTNSAPKYALPGLKTLANDTMSLYHSGEGYQQYPGSGVAGQSNPTLHGQQALVNNANGGRPDALYKSVNSGLLGVSQGGGLNSIQNDALSKYQSLYGGDDSFENALTASNQRIQDQLNRQFSGMGAYGNTDNAGALGRNLSDNSAQYLFQNQANKANLAGQIAGIGQQGIANQQSIAGLLPTLHDAKNANANDLLNVGLLRDNYNQSLLDDKIARFDRGQATKRQRISDTTGLLTGQAGNYGTQSTSSKTPSLFQQILGGGLAAAGTAAKLYGG